MSRFSEENWTAWFLYRRFWRRAWPDRKQWIALTRASVSLTSSLLVFTWVLTQKNADLEGLKLLLGLGTGNFVIESFVLLKDIVLEVWTRDVQPIPVIDSASATRQILPNTSEAVPPVPENASVKERQKP